MGIENEEVTMLQIGDTIVSLDLFKRKFLCDLASCKGQCCVDGEEGAPLEKQEIEELNKALPVVWNSLPKHSQEVIVKQGVSYVDPDGDDVTSIVNGADCVFVYRDENGYAKCAIEKAFLEGKLNFRKPISCYLYPVRVQKYKSFTAVNFHEWHICNCAVKAGKKGNLPVYQFLREPLVSKFGKAWYEELQLAAEALKDNMPEK